MRGKLIRNVVRGALIGALAGYFWAKRAGKLPGKSGFLFRIPLPWLAFDDQVTKHWPFFVAAIAGYVAFGVYWEMAAKNAAQSKRTESTASRGVHVALTNVALLLEVVTIRGLGRFTPALPLIMTMGLAIEAAGVALAIWARRHLGRNWSGRIAIKEGHELVRSGPYEFLRHPIYTAILAMYAGIAIVTGEWLGVIGFVVVLLAYWRKIRLEEAVLDKAFGPAYDSYRRDTWALVPWVL
jgi:protein-S-isoprenylcysteine O-methyltransferase Ste14